MVSVLKMVSVPFLSFTNQGVFNITEKPESVWWVKIRNNRGQTGWSNHPEAFGNMDACE